MQHRITQSKREGTDRDVLDIYAMQSFMMSDTGDNGDARSRVMKAMRKVMDTEITDAQRRYISLYYFGGYDMQGVAQECGVTVSTVSRTLKRARQRMKRALEYVYIGASGSDED